MGVLRNSHPSSLFGVLRDTCTNQVGLKPACSATEASHGVATLCYEKTCLLHVRNQELQIMRSNSPADQHLCFRCLDTTFYFLNPKSSYCGCTALFGPGRYKKGFLMMRLIFFFFFLSIVLILSNKEKIAVMLQCVNQCTLWRLHVSRLC